MFGYEYPNHSPAEYDDAAMQGVDLAFVFGMRATAAGVLTANEYVDWFCAQHVDEHDRVRGGRSE